MKYILITFDGYWKIYPCYRKAKAGARRAMQFTYSARIEPYRGPLPAYSEGVE